MFSAERGIKKKFYQDGDVVFTEGDAGDRACIIETGAIGIYKTINGEEMQLATMRDGELFGEMAIIDGSPRMAHARAVEDTVVIQIPKKVVESKIQSSEPFFKGLIQILVDNLRNVHRVYMRRPRSLNDYLSNVAFQTEGLRSYLQSRKDPGPWQEGLACVKVIEASLVELNRVFADHRDRRDDSIGESDVTRQKADP